MGLFKGIGKALKKALKVINPITYYTRNVFRDTTRLLRNDPLKFAMLVGAAALTGGAAAGLAGGTAAAGAGAAGGAAASGAATGAAGAGAATAAGAGAGAATASTMAALKTAALAAGTAATYRSGVQEERALHAAEKQEKASKVGEAIETAEYNKKVSQANERAYQRNRAALLSARKQYTGTSNTSGVRLGKTSDETDLYKLG